MRTMAATVWTDVVMRMEFERPIRRYSNSSDEGMVAWMRGTLCM